MPIINQGFTTVTCDSPDCDKTLTFEARPEGLDAKVLEENPWLKTNLVVRTTDQRTFAVCSKLCLVKAAEAGLFDPIEPKQVKEATGLAAVAAAAAEARRKQIADDAIRNGQPAKVSLT